MDELLACTRRLSKALGVINTSPPLTASSISLRNPNLPVEWYPRLRTTHFRRSLLRSQLDFWHFAVALNTVHYNSVARVGNNVDGGNGRFE